MIDEAQTANHLIAMDEAGNTGENLLDAAQPVFTLAALNVEESVAENLVARALARTQMTELKFAALRRSGPGRRNVLALLEAAKFTPGTVSVIAADKRWMLASKLVDELVEPRMLQLGQQLAWYGSGVAFEMADVLYERGRPELGELYDELAAAFVPLVRDYSHRRGAAFRTALSRARIAARDRKTSEVLGYMIDTDEELEHEFATRTDALDPAVACFSWQVSEWSERVGDFEVLHDDAAAVERWAPDLVMARDPAGSEVPSSRRVIEVGGARVTMPYGLRQTSFAQSHRDARLQLADIVAGATAHIYATACGLRPEDTFGRALERQGVGELIQQDIGPALSPLRAARLGSRARGERRR